MYAYKGENDFFFFIYYLLSPIIITFGFIGNTIGLLILKRKALGKIGPIIMHYFLFIMDSLYLITFLQSYLSRSYGINYLPYSTIGCKAFQYSVHSLAPLSPLAIIYIAFDRFVSLKFPIRRLLFKKNKSQFIAISVFILFNLLYKIPILVIYETVNKNGTWSCTIVNMNSRLLILYMDFGWRVVFLSTLMIIISIFIIYCIFESRKRVLRATTANSRTIKRDIRLSVISLLINVIYIILNFPLNFTSFYSSSIPEYIYLITLNLFYLSYAINFYIILFSNSLVRRELLLILHMHFIEGFSLSKFSRRSNTNQQSSSQ